MRGRAEIAKGRIEEAAGALAGSDKLRKKGKTDQAVGQVRLTVEKAVNRVAKRLRA